MADLCTALHRIERGGSADPGNRNELLCCKNRMKKEKEEFKKKRRKKNTYRSFFHVKILKYNLCYINIKIIRICENLSNFPICQNTELLKILNMSKIGEIVKKSKIIKIFQIFKKIQTDKNHQNYLNCLSINLSNPQNFG